MQQQTSTTPKELFGALAAGAVVLMVVHELGRFIYTPLLPYLVDDGPWLTKQWLDAGGSLASAFGIGVGALAFGLIFVFFVPRPEVWHARTLRFD